MKKEKVALLTWWHYHNYGTALQLTALYSIIKSLSYDADVVKYVPSGKKYSTKSEQDLQLMVDNQQDSERVIDKKRDLSFNSYLDKHLTFTNNCTTDDDFNELNDQYDAFVSGSDQIWAPTIFDARYFQDFVTDNRKKIAYAPSVGLPVIENDWVKERVTNLTSQFAHLSVREKSGAKIISELTNRKVETMPDPTLLLNYSEWRKTIPRSKRKAKEKYVACYFLGENPNSWEHVTAISKQLNLPVKILPVFSKDQQFGEFVKGAGPDDFFNIIDDAEVVLTDSFHGAIFSMICSTPFYVFERFRDDDQLSQNSRIYNLLELVGLTDRLIAYYEAVKDEYNFTIDFSDAQKAIVEEKKKAVDYLRSSLVINNPLVSVIVPVYNVEKYIKKCLNSISEQTYRNLEIIVVDDGTPDKSGEIADQCAKADLRIKVIHKKNKGVSVARNTGLDIAKGKYVVFVDSDDIIAPNFVEYMLGLAENTGANIGASLYSYNEYCGEQNITTTNDRFEMYMPERAVEGVYAWFYPLPVWNKIYRRSFIEKHHVRFLPELPYAEGMTFNVMALQNSGSVAVGKKQLYYQTFNPDSATRSTNMMKWEACFLAYNYQKEHSKIWSDRINRAYNLHRWWGNVSIARQIYKAGEEQKYAKYLQKYLRRIRFDFMAALRADVSRWQKKQYTKIFFNPKKALNEMNAKEAEMVKNSKILDSNIMPWDDKTSPESKNKKTVTSDSHDAEANRIRIENARLNAELASFLSIKRSARLLLGNIKRRIRHGKNR